VLEVRETDLSDRRKEIQEALLSANIGCLLLCLLAVGVPLTGLGGFFVVRGFSAVQDQARLNELAIEVPATIISSAVQETSSGNEPSGRKQSYWPEVEFSYEYGGETRTSKKVWPVAESGREAEVREVVDRYPPAAKVTAFVDPDDPSTAFLERRWGQLAYVSILIGCLPLAFVVGLGVLLTGWRRPSLAVKVALLAGIVIIAVVMLAAEHYLRVMPEHEKARWVWFVCMGAGLMALAPLAAVAKARSLHRLYRQAQG
jgi:hypothetical protein